MHNLIRCPKRHCVVPKVFNFPFKNVYFHSKKKIFFDIKHFSCARNNEYNRLFLPVSYHAFKKICKEIYTVRSVLLHGNINTFNFPRRFDNVRHFNTTCSNSNKQLPKESGSENSDKDPDLNEEMKIFLRKLSMFLLLMCVPFIALKQEMNKWNIEPTASVSWNEFVYHMLNKGEVEVILVNPNIEHVMILVHEGAIIKGMRSPYNRYYMSVPDIEHFEEKLRKVEKDLGIKAGQGVQIIYERKTEYMANMMKLFMVPLSIVFLAFIMRQFRVKPVEFISQLKQAKFTLVEPLVGQGKGVHFTDVAGLKEAKIEVMEFVDYLKHPERYKVLGAKVPQGALLLGPPGCGKTLLAKAVATEASVPFLSMNGSEFIEVFGGLGAARVRDLFKEAKKRAPSIIYIDEIDAIGKKRSDSSLGITNSESERTLNQLLVEMDGMIAKKDVIILASTNRADVLDKALLRPGRFDRHILIDFPTLDERQQIFETHLKILSLQNKPSKYSGYLAYLTPGFSGADIANICNEAALYAARNKKKQVDSSDLMYAIDKTIGGLTKRNNPLTPSTKRVVAYHEAGHALVGWLLEHTDALLKVTIVPRTNLSLGFAQYSQSDRKLFTKEELFERMCMMLGGRAAEHIIFDKISTGAENDLKKVTKTAYMQVQQFGMSPTIGLISFNEKHTNTENRKPYSKKLANLMDAEVRKMIAEAYERTRKLLLDNKDKLSVLAEALLKEETLTYDDIEKLIGPPPYGKKRLLELAEFKKVCSARESPSR